MWVFVKTRRVVPGEAVFLLFFFCCTARAIYNKMYRGMRTRFVPGGAVLAYGRDLYTSQ